eukprot:evm.model.scf_887.12 EVM.evm.TU.scf_887.12   scf_887:57048-59292(-)
MDPAGRGRAGDAGGQKGPSHRGRKSEQQGGRAAEHGERGAVAGASQGPPRGGRERRANASGQKSSRQTHQVDGGLRANPLGPAIPKARRTDHQRRPRDLSLDGFVQELFSTKGRLAEVSVDTPKEREVAEALYSLANLFRSPGSPEDEGSADNRPARPQLRRPARRQRTDGSTRRRDEPHVGGRHAHRVINSRSPAAAIRPSGRGRRDGSDSESDVTDSDGASASWMEAADGGDKAPRRAHGRHEVARGVGGVGRRKRMAVGGVGENGESVGNSQVCEGNGEGPRASKRRSEKEAIAEGGAPQAKRTRTASKRVACGGESRKPEVNQGERDGEAKNADFEKIGEVPSQQRRQQHQQPFRSLMDAIQGVYLRSLFGNVLNRPEAPKDQIPLAGSSFSALDLQAMMQMGGLMGRHEECTNASKSERGLCT